MRLEQITEENYSNKHASAHNHVTVSASEHSFTLRGALEPFYFLLIYLEVLDKGSACFDRKAGENTHSCETKWIKVRDKEDAIEFWLVAPYSF